MSARLVLEDVPDSLGRWPGSKRWLPALHAKRLPSPSPRGRFFEPCAGAAALSIHYALRGCRVVLGDTNPRLIGVYRHLLTDARAVAAALGAIVAGHDAADDKKAFYFAQRDVWNGTDVESIESAAGFLFVMNAGFNGVTRFNQSGGCNTPYGEPEPGKDLVRAHELVALGALLKRARAEVVLGDFEATVAPARRGDFVYFDPPYVRPKKNAAELPARGEAGPGFVGYSAKGFTLADRKRLGVVLRDLDRRGVRWMLSDLSAEHALAVYGLWSVREVNVKRSVAAKGEARGRAREVIVTNF